LPIFDCYDLEYESPISNLFTHTIYHLIKNAPDYKITDELIQTLNANSVISLFEKGIIREIMITLSKNALWKMHKK
jgi:hypothetical protein